MDTVTAARDAATGAYPNTFDVSATGPVAVTSPVIDANGDIGGLYSDSTGTRVLTQANGGAATAAALPAGATNLKVAGIDSTGAVYGSYTLPGANGGTYSFKDSGGTVTQIAGPNGAAGVAVLSVNAAGTVAGVYTDKTGATQVFTAANGTATPVALPAGATFSGLAPIDAQGDVAGIYTSNNTFIGFIAAAGSTTATTVAAPAGTLQSVAAVSSGGAVAGVDASGSTYSAFYDPATGAAQQIALPANAGQFLSVVGFDASGDVLGTYNDKSGNTQSFVYTPGAPAAVQFSYAGPTPDGSLSVQSTTVTGIDASGDVLGTYRDANGTYGFVERNNTFTTVPAAQGGGTAQPTGEDAAGDVVGTSSATGAAFVDRGGASAPLTVTGQLLPTISAVYTYVPSTDSDLPPGYVDPLGQVVGTVTDATGTHAFVAGPGSTASFDGAPGATSTVAYGSDAAGDAAGTYTDAQGQQHVFLRTADGTVTRLDPSGDSYASFDGINAAGAVALTYNDTTGQHAAVYANGALTTIAPFGATSSDADFIDGAGDVFGDYQGSDNNHIFERTAAGTVTRLDPNTDDDADLYAQNAAGDVVGVYGSDQNNGDVGIFTVVGGQASTTSLKAALGAKSLEDVSLDAAGDAYGEYYDGANYHDFYQAAGSTTAVRIDPTTDSRGAPYGLLSNGAGTVVGTDTDAKSGAAQVFVYANGKTTAYDVTSGGGSSYLAGVDAAGDVVGTAYSGMTPTPFGIVAGVEAPLALPTDAGTNPNGSVTGITASGLVVGAYRGTDGGQHFFATQAGSATATRLDPAGSTNFAVVQGSFSGYGQATPANGAVAFNYNDASGASHGLLDLGGQVTVVNGSPTATSTTLTSIDAQGNITGTYTDAAGTHAFASFAAAMPTVSGTHARSTTGEAALPLFSGVTVGDGNAGAAETLTVTLSGAGGALSDGAGYSGLKQNADGSYALSGTAAAVTAELDALSFKPAAAGTTTFTLKDVTSVGGVFTNTVTDSATVVTDTAAAVAPAPTNPAPAPTSPAPAPTSSAPAPTSPAPTSPAPAPANPAPAPTNPAPLAPAAVSVAQQVSYGDGTFTIAGTASAGAGVRGVEITATVDGVATDLGAAAVNPDGSFTFQDAIGAHTQGFITATVTDGAGGTASARAGYALTGGERGAYEAEQDRYSADGSAETATDRFKADGSQKADLMAGGQTFSSASFDTFDDHGQPSTTFVFDPGFGRDAVSLFRVDGTDHDTLSFKGSDYGNSVAAVLNAARDTKAGLLITDPTASSPGGGPGTHDTLLLKGINKAQLAANGGDIAFHA